MNLLQYPFCIWFLLFCLLKRDLKNPLSVLHREDASLDELNNKRLKESFAPTELNAA